MKQDDTVVPESPEPRWLHGVERDAWLSLIGVIIRLPASLDTQLQRDAGLSHFEYIVMVNLSNAEGHVLRMSQLAAQCHSSLSRLSHVVARLERRSWLRRDPCPDDGRATLATLTDEGFAKLASAAPGHVEAVPRLRHRHPRPAAAAASSPRSARRSSGRLDGDSAAPVERTMPLVTTAPSMRATTGMPAAFLGHGNPDERAGRQPLHPGVAGVRRGGPAAAGDPGGLGALVHQRHGGHRHAAAAHDPRLLRLPQRLFDVEYPAPGLPELVEEVADVVHPTWVGATSTAGASTTAPGRCWCTPSPRPTSRSCS